MIIEIEGRTYHGVDVSQLSLRNTLTLQRELAATGISSARTWEEVQGLIREFSALPEAERGSHPEGLFLTALTIWAARVSAGEDLSLLDAVDVPLSAVRFIAEPTDHKVPAGKAQAGRTPAKGGKKRR